MHKRRGIVNRGNSCFLNSTLQCLAVSPFILEFIDNYSNNDNEIIRIINKYELGKFNSNEINVKCESILQEPTTLKEDVEILEYISKNSSILYIYISFKEIIKNLNNGANDPVDNTLFVSINKEISAYYGFDYLFNGDQNDPHEFMVYLLDKLHDAKKTKTIINEPENIDTLLTEEELDELNHQSALTHLGADHTEDARAISF